MKYLGVDKNVAWQAQGVCSIGTTYGGVQTGAGGAWACFVNGYFSVLFPLHGRNYGENRGWLLFSFDDNGNVCKYQSSDYIFNSNIQGIEYSHAYQSGNDFLYSVDDLGSFRFRIPTVFIPGGTVTVPSIVGNPASPCGGGTLERTVFLDTQNLIAYEYYHAYSNADDTWASIYSKDGTFLGGGYIGNYPSNYEPFYRVDNTLPSGVTANQSQQKSGANFFTNGNVTYSQQKLGFNFTRLVGPYADLVCGAPNPNVYIESYNASYLTASSAGIPAFAFDGEKSVKSGATDLEGLFAVNYHLTNAGALVSPDFFLDIQTPNSGVRNAGFGYSHKKKRVYYLQDTSGGYGKTYQLFSAPYDAGALSPRPVVSLASFPGLANYHRAVSPFGTFEA